MAAVCTALQHLGFTADAAQAITINQGIDSLDGLRELTDTEVENLCKVIRKPSGIVLSNTNSPNFAPNQGQQVFFRAEIISKLTCFYIHHTSSCGSSGQ